MNKLTDTGSRSREKGKLTGKRVASRNMRDRILNEYTMQHADEGNGIGRYITSQKQRIPKDDHTMASSRRNLPTVGKFKYIANRLVEPTGIMTNSTEATKDIFVSALEIIDDDMVFYGKHINSSEQLCKYTAHTYARIYAK